MRRMGIAGLLALAAGIVALPPAAGAAPALESCGEEERGCARLTVPLDRSGAEPGSVRLLLDLDRAEPSATAPPVVAIGGVQGQASSQALSALDASIAVGPRERVRGRRVVQPAPTRDVVALDLRGTGGSDVLCCPELERNGLGDGAASAAAACAAALGPRRGFYTARDSAEDIEAVRLALGVERIALLGESYGARVALTYARLHPERVERLMVLTPPAPEGDDLLLRGAMAALPAAIAARCGPRACRHVSRTPADDVSALARRLERAPLAGAVLDGSGRPRPATLTSYDLLELAGGWVLGETAFPGLVVNALRGDPQPLLRIAEVVRWYEEVQRGSVAVPGFSVAAYTASICEESMLPWGRTEPLADRLASASAFANGLPAGAFGPFGPRTALQSRLLELCRLWPVASAAPDPVEALPATPALVMTGARDLYATPADALATARLIPGARVLRIPGDRSETSLEVGSCTAPAAEAFFNGGPVPKRCGGPLFPRQRAAPALPLALREVDPEPGARGKVGRTLAAVRLTLRDGAAFLPARFFVRVVSPSFRGGPGSPELYRRPVRVGGLRAGSYQLSFRRARFALRDAVHVPGVRVSGDLAPRDPRAPGKPRGRLRIGGSAAARGTLALRGRMLTGRLAGRPVRMRVGDALYPDVSFGR